MPLLQLSKISFLGPDKGGARPYALLHEAMKETDSVAVARYSARGKEYLVLMRPHESGLVSQELHYADEIRSITDVPIDDVAIDDAELAMATQLIQQTAVPQFEPNKYTDGVKSRLLEMIEQKVAGSNVIISPADEPKAQVIDLMDALKASLDGGATKPAAKPARKGRKPATKRAPRKKAVSE